MSSSRVPPCLLYLTIYNPTLVPSGPPNPDEEDEDAEEQAHILFYTSRERAVSRDRMLRQIGLAKALVNFSQMFNHDEPSENVHSQSKRMLMVSPEPDFWIHAGIEVAKTPRVPPPPEKKLKGKKTADKDGIVVYDYHEASVDDLALRKYVLRGYEQFKLTHGSFSTILSSLGQQALELQLERFFTVWAWSWNLEDMSDFGEQLGVPLHPMHRSVQPILDTFSCQLPEEVVALVISPPCVIPSTRLVAKQYPSALAIHILSLVSAQKPPLVDIPPAKGEDGAVPEDSDSDSRSFLGIPTTNGTMGLNKWNWPEYLTFGKGAVKKLPVGDVINPETANKDVGTERAVGLVEVGVDTAALEDAISSDSVSISKSLTTDTPSTDSDPPATNPAESSNHVDDPITRDSPSSEEEHRPAEGLTTAAFLSAHVHLTVSSSPTETQLQRVSYMVKWPLAVALIGPDQLNNFAYVSGPTEKLLTDLGSLFVADAVKSAADLPSAVRILQPKDTHIIATSNFTSSSGTGFASKSGNLFNAQLLQARNPDIVEVFSRGQNPQHWHVARDGLSSSGERVKGKIYMEVGRQEASLTDVDNLLAGALKQYT